MFHSYLIRYLANQNKNHFKLKVILGGQKVLSSTLSQHTTLKKWLNGIQPNKLYQITILYKDKGDYIPTDNDKIFAYKSNCSQGSDNKESEIFLFQKKMFESNYVEIANNFLIYGRSDKKIIVEESPLCIFLARLHFSDQGLFDLPDQTIHWITGSKIHLEKELSKFLSPYEFDYKITGEKNQESKHELDIHIVLKSKKSIWRRCLDWIHRN
jgi:hypothetical protein